MDNAIIVAAVNPLVEQITTLAVTVIAGVLVALTQRLWVWVAASARKADASILDGAIGRAAGLVISEADLQNMAQGATDVILNHGVDYVQRSFPDLLKRVGSPSPDHIKDMIRGEVGKLLASAPK